MRIMLFLLVLPIASVLTACGDECYNLDSDCDPHVQDPHYSISKPIVKMDGAGNAITIWNLSYSKEVTPGSFKSKDYVNFALFSPGSGWGKQTSLAAYNGKSVSSPIFSIDKTGNGIAIWRVSSDVINAAYTPGAGWSAPTILLSHDTIARYVDIDVAMNDSGQAFAVVYDAGNHVVYAIPYLQGQGWIMDNIESIAATHGLDDLSVAINSNGHVVVSWVEYDQDLKRSNLAVTRYVPNSGWDATELVASTNKPGTNHRVAIDSIGNIVIEWADYTTLWGINYSPYSGWGAAVKIHTATKYIQEYDLVMNTNGTVASVWLDDSGVIWFTQCSPDTGWSNSQAIYSAVDTKYTPRVAIDNSGNIIVLWRQYSTTNSFNNQLLLAQLYLVGYGWNTPQHINYDNYEISDLSIAMNYSGDAVAIWDQIFTTCSSSQCYIDVQLWGNNFSSDVGWSTASLIGKSQLK